MTTRWDVERAALAAELPPTSLLLLLVLATLTDSQTAVIPAKHTPSISDLVRMSGRARSTVCVHLKDLEQAGWLIRRRPSKARARAEHARTQYALRVPAEVIHSPSEASPETEGSSPVNGSELVRPSAISSPADGHVFPTPTSPTRARARAWEEEAITTITDTLREVAPGRADAHTRTWAERVLQALPLDGVRARVPYIEKVLRNDPTPYLPSSSPPPVHEALAAAVPREDPM